MNRGSGGEEIFVVVGGELGGIRRYRARREGTPRSRKSEVLQ